MGEFWAPGGREEGPSSGRGGGVVGGGCGCCHDSALSPFLLLHPQAITALAPQLSIPRTVLGGISTSSHAW